MELATQNHNPESGRCEFELYRSPIPPLRSRGVGSDTCSFHHLTKVSNTFWLVIPSKYRHEVWLIPPIATSFSAYSTASSKSLARYIARVGDSFS